MKRSLLELRTDNRPLFLYNCSQYIFVNYQSVMVDIFLNFYYDKANNYHKQKETLSWKENHKFINSPVVLSWPH